MRMIIFLSLLILNGEAFGGWASGGGEIHRDAHNPWFLENTKSVQSMMDSFTR